MTNVYIAYMYVWITDICVGDIPQYATHKVGIKKIHPITKRDEEDEHYMIENLDKPMEVILHPNHNLISGRYVRILQWFSFNHSHNCVYSLVVQEAAKNTAGLKTIEHSKVKDCFYTGEVVDHPSATVSVSVCDGKMVS